MFTNPADSIVLISSVVASPGASVIRGGSQTVSTRLDFSTHDVAAPSLDFDFVEGWQTVSRHTRTKSGKSTKIRFFSFEGTLHGSRAGIEASIACAEAAISSRGEELREGFLSPASAGPGMFRRSVQGLCHAEAQIISSPLCRRIRSTTTR